MSREARRCDGTLTLIPAGPFLRDRRGRGLAWGTHAALGGGPPRPRLLAATILGSYFLAWGTALILAAPPRSRVITRFALTTLALALPLGCLELLSVVGMADFRTWFPTSSLDPRHNGDNIPDRELIHIHKPYLKRAGATHGDIAYAFHLADAPLYPYDVAYDRNGFRNDRDLTEAEIVVLGDSFVEGGPVAADNLITANLGRFVGCNVANLGQSGYGPQQELAVLRRSLCRCARKSASGRSMRGTTSTTSGVTSSSRKTTAGTSARRLGNAPSAATFYWFSR